MNKSSQWYEWYKNRVEDMIMIIIKIIIRDHGV
jgi:hypothetical protein